MMIDRFADQDRAAFLAASTPVDFAPGQVLYRGGEPLTHCLFVEAGVLSAVTTTQDGRTVEAYMVGREGAANVWSGEQPASRHSSLVVQVAGRGRRIEARQFQALMEQRPGVRSVVGRYLDQIRDELEQGAACNALHRAEQRFAKWLLCCHDRTDGDVMHLTQENLASMLGSQRTTVNEAAQALQRAGAISYSRGKVVVRDRALLERAACECYAGAHAGQRLIDLPGPTSA